MANENINLAEIPDVSAILRLFEEHYQVPTFDPVPYLSRFEVIMVKF